MPESLNKRLVVKNSALLYVRMLFTMWINLYATRLTLQNLGVEDMGVYGVVGSIVSLTGVLASGTTNAVQRFLTFELGRKDGEPNAVFCTSLNFVFLLSGLTLLVLEVGGLAMLYHKVKIPAESMNAAFWVFQFSVFTCLVNLVSIPYNALIIAHERMSAFAGISILQVILNCAAAYSISFFADGRLVWYGGFMAGIGLLVRIVYQVYCHRNFSESRYYFALRKDLLKELGRFAGVTTLSGILQTIVGEGLVLVINLTFGAALNAVYVIALQLKNSILSFAMNVYKAISPQITKTYASGEIEHHKALVYTGSKMAVYMLYLIFFPFLFQTDYIMHLWLGKVPPYTVEFAQAMAFVSLTYAAFEPIRSAVLATNRITKFMLVPDSFYLLVLPLGYFVAKLGDNPVSLIVTIVAFDMLTCIVRVCYAVKYTVLTFRELYCQFLRPVVLLSLGTGLLQWGIQNVCVSHFGELVIRVVVNGCFILVFVLASEKDVRRYLQGRVKR
jgi:conserved hypothetical transmembrane protein; putative transmembrane protein